MDKEIGWGILYPPDTWFSTQPFEGTGNGTITVNYNANTGSARTGTITITAEGATSSPQTVEIRQASGYEGNYQAAILKSSSTSLIFGDSFDVTLIYDCSDNTVGNFTAAIYYDSAMFVYEGSTVLYKTGMLGEIHESSDTENKDGDELTDSSLAIAYLDIMGTWPGTELPLDLVTFHFITKNADGATSINVKSLGTPGGFEFQGIGVDFTVCCDISLPTVMTAEVNSVTPTTALSGGNIISEGESPVTAKGICWSTSPVSDTGPLPGTHTVNGPGTGSFSNSITGLTPDTTYYIRAYATNNQGTSFGQGLSFKTLLSPGDVNGDKSIGLDDAILVLNVISGTDTGEITVRSDADVNEDGKIGLQESVYVLQIISDL